MPQQLQPLRNAHSIARHCMFKGMTGHDNSTCNTTPSSQNYNDRSLRKQRYCDNMIMYCRQWNSLLLCRHDSRTTTLLSDHKRGSSNLDLRTWMSSKHTIPKQYQEVCMRGASARKSNTQEKQRREKIRALNRRVQNQAASGRLLPTIRVQLLHVGFWQLFQS